MAEELKETENPYKIDYTDSRFTDVEAAKDAALKEVTDTYSGMLGQTDSFYKDQMEAAKQWEEKQSALQQEQTDFTIEQLEQQKEQARKDYTKEQSGAYTDWQKQSNQYGVNAEQQAAMGMQNTGFSESSQVGMYNTYQSRVAAARESYSRAVLNYDNAMKDARLQNNSALAQIAYNSLQQQLELALQGFQYRNQLLLQQADKKLDVENMYWGRYQDVLSQINTEHALAEQIRQFNEQLAEQQRQFNYKHKLGEFARKSSGRSSRSSSSGPPPQTDDTVTLTDYAAGVAQEQGSRLVGWHSLCPLLMSMSEAFSISFIL